MKALDLGCGVGAGSDSEDVFSVSTAISTLEDWS